MTPTRTSRTSRGFTLTELLIVVALVGIILALSGPPLADYIRVQRLKGISAELTTDLSFARSEAVSRGTYMQVRVQSGTDMSCYIVFARADADVTSPCDCTAAAGSRCSVASMMEVKTVVVPQSSMVTVSAPGTNPVTPTNILTINPRTGGVFVGSVAEFAGSTDFSIDAKIDSARGLRTIMTQSGMVKACLAPGASMAGVPAC